MFFLNDTHKDLAAALHNSKNWELASDFPEVAAILNELDMLADMIDNARKEDKFEAFRLLGFAEDLLQELRSAA